jgi:hypothetical protein
MKIATKMTTKIALQRLWHSRFEWWMSVVCEAFVAGTLGGAVVALWYLLSDSIEGRPFHTPALLGAIIFNGLRGHDVGAPMLAPVLSFTVVHFAAFIAFGLALALVIVAAEREPLLVLGALIVYACFEISFLAFVTALDESALGALGWWKIAAANAITLVTVFGYFQYRHPKMLRRFSERWDDFDAGELAAQPTVAARVIPLAELSTNAIPTGK